MDGSLVIHNVKKTSQIDEIITWLAKTNDICKDENDSNWLGTWQSKVTSL